MLELIAKKPPNIKSKVIIITISVTDRVLSKTKVNKVKNKVGKITIMDQRKALDYIFKSVFLWIIAGTWDCTKP